MKTLVNLTIACGCLIAANSSAGTIYEFVDYPDLQNGYTLSGTIEVADNAADDGVLETDEILDWSWAADGALPYAGRLQRDSDITSTFTLTWAEGVEIDSQGIYLPAADRATFFMRYGFAQSHSSLPLFPRLSWSAYTDAVRYSLFVWDYDYEFDVWDETIPREPSGGRWLVATAIPEPTASLLAAAGILGGMARRTVANRM